VGLFFFLLFRVVDLEIGHRDAVDLACRSRTIRVVVMGSYENGARALARPRDADRCSRPACRERRRRARGLRVAGVRLERLARLRKGRDRWRELLTSGMATAPEPLGGSSRRDRISNTGGDSVTGDARGREGDVEAVGRGRGARPRNGDSPLRNTAKCNRSACSVLGGQYGRRSTALHVDDD